MRAKRILFLLAGVYFANGVTMSGEAFAQAAGTSTDTKQPVAQVNPDGTSTTLSPPPPSGASNYLDDRLMWNHTVAAWSYKQLLTDPNHADFCLPANTIVTGETSGFYTATKATGTDQAAVAAAAAQKSASLSASSGQYLPIVVDRDGFPFSVFGGKNITEANKLLRPTDDKGQPLPVPVCAAIGTTPPILTEGDTLYVASGETDNAIRFGWDYGALAVPFKIQLAGKHSISGTSTLGGYFGFRIPMWDSGLVFSPIAFAGASNIATSSTTAGVTTSQTVAGLSFGGGLITRVKNSGFQIGLVAGIDHVDSAQPYAYNDKVWMSLEIGYSFAQ
jgi:hypothetical protein